ncbi:MAG TPA: hypothetical protein VMR28_01815 [Candidatus Saccharimonadales bacterium]|nr:hypothetical protein [Candidatus Saccharimonadales bacterium]
MDDLVQQLSKDFPTVHFQTGKSFRWAPNQKEITYRQDGKSNGAWTILHELGHALLGHKNYNSDFELLKLEVAAWGKAQELQIKYSQRINPEYIQNCLDTYREWLHRRSTCPMCSNRSLQSSSTEYGCFNCHTSWKVTTARFCRPYRRIHSSENEKSPETKAQATFI